MTNPLLQDSSLPYALPDFAKITADHYAPALKAAMAQHRAEVEEILAQESAPTVENTLVALERSGQRLSAAAAVFFNVASADATSQVQEIEAEVTPLLTEHHDAITLDPRLFARIDDLYQRRPELQLDEETDWLLAETWRDLVRNGAKLGADQRAQLAEFNTRLASLETEFGQRLLEDTNAKAVVVTDREELAGLSDDEIAVLAAAADRRGLPAGSYAIELELPSGQPILARLANRALRERIHRASVSRGATGGATDTSELVLQIAQTRAQRARLLGHANHAAVIAEEGTAKTSQAVMDLLSQLGPIAAVNAQREAEELQELLQGDHPGATLEAWDWAYYAQQVRTTRYAVDDAQLRNYFPLRRVLQDGVFYAATELYGITFQHRPDLVGYHDDVEIYEVFEADGSGVGLFLFDPYTRETKRGGAWMNDLIGQNRLLGQRAIIVNNLNIAKPADPDRTLLTIDEVRTLFHEFGHALHGLLSNVTYPSHSGTAVPRDVVEFPSQVNEMWMLHPDVLPRYARHIDTGEPLPADIAQRLRAAAPYGQGFATTEYLAASLLDQAWHHLAADDPVFTAADANSTVAAAETRALEEAGVALREVPPRYRSTYFAHTFAGGYDAAYYSYIWAEVLDADTVNWFEQHGGLSRETGERFRAALLGRGGSADVMAMYRDLHGREPNLEPLLTRRGLLPA